MTDVVLVWREAGSTRLRTYVDEVSYRPVATPLDQVDPPLDSPDLVITTQEQLDAYLSSLPPLASQGPIREPVHAISVEIAESQLGWVTTAT